MIPRQNTNSSIMTGYCHSPNQLLSIKHWEKYKGVAYRGSLFNCQTTERNDINLSRHQMHTFLFSSLRQIYSRKRRLLSKMRTKTCISVGVELRRSHVNQIELIKGCFVCLLVVLVFNGNCEVTSAVVPPQDSSSTSGTIFTVAEIQEYREDRYHIFQESLSDASLTKEHRDLIASALSKTYSGVPLCSFTFALNAQGNEASPSEEEAVWIVSESGGTERMNNEDRRHYRDAPISFVPNNPFDLARGTVVGESKSSVKYRFPLTPRLIAPNLDSDAVRVLRKLDWVAELTVDTKQEAPISLLLTLASDDGRAHAPLVNVDVARVEFLYQYNDSCQYYEVFSKLRHFQGSSLFTGDFLDKTIKTFTNVQCKQPVAFLLPEKKELEFIERY